MRHFLRNRLAGNRPSRLFLCVGITAASIAAVAVVAATLHGGRAVQQGHSRLFAVHPLPCGSGAPGPVGTVVRASGTAPLADQGIGFPVATLAQADGSTLYVAPFGAALPASGPSSVQLGTVTVPSALSAYQSCGYTLQGNQKDLAFKAAAYQAFASAGLATGTQLDGQGVIWMVADDPTSASDELVIADIETPRTSSSPGTIRTLVAAVATPAGPSSTAPAPSAVTVLGVAAADW
jgi:hypothetical protein